MKILIVEDDPSMIDLYRVWLKTTKAEVDYCDNSFKVANKILTGEIRDYDLLIVDLKLEGSKDGDKVVDLLRDIELSEKEKTPILFLSGHISEEIKGKYKNKKYIQLLEKTSVNSEVFRNKILETITGMEG